MESGQLAKKVEWMEDQRRKENELVKALKEEAHDLAGELNGVKDQLGEMGAGIARLSALAGRIREFDESLHRHREEIGRQIEDLELRRESRDQQLAETRRSEIDELNEKIASVRETMNALVPIEESLETRKEEEQRLSRLVDQLTKRLEDLEDSRQDLLRQISSIETARAKESTRVADLQSETANLRNQLESLEGSKEAHSDRMRSLEARIQEVSVAESSRNESVQAWTENQSRRLVDFERSWKDWLKKFEEFDRKAQVLDERMAKYEETFRGVKQVEKRLESVIDRMERRVNEITEMQRLSDDRLRQEWANFQADDQKRWNTFKLGSEERWREHDRVHGKLASSVEASETNIDELLVTLERIESAGATRVKELLEIVRSWVDRIETGGRSG